MGVYKDLTGLKFSRLTVVKRMDKDITGSWRWLCKCDCGNETLVNSYHLKSGKIRKSKDLISMISKASS